MNYAKGVAMCGAIFMASAAVATIAIPAQARTRPVVVTAPSADTATRLVSYRDLNLASYTGERILKQRVNFAVKDVCNEVASEDLDVNFDCRSTAWRGARPQIKQAVLRAHQIAATGQSLIGVSAITLSVGR